MICILLVAGHGTRLEEELERDTTGRYAKLAGVPKALLPIANSKSALDMWWEAIDMRRVFHDVFLVTNANKYKYYERWASAHHFPIANIINDGTTSHEGRLGAAASVDLVLRAKSIEAREAVTVVAGDMAFYPNSFDLSSVVAFFEGKAANVVVHYELSADESASSRGIVELDSATGRVTRFFEKPSAGMTTSRNASVVLYCFQPSAKAHFRTYLDASAAAEQHPFGLFLAHLLSQDVPLYGMKLPTKFKLIGNVGLKEYEECISECRSMQEGRAEGARVSKRAFARVGLMGNPSDGFNGKTISLSIRNFWAKATIERSEQLRLIPHPLNDPTEFGSLADLYGISRKEGYQGGLRLMQATCKKFYQYCTERGIAFARHNFTLSYDTNIPRQVGLAGSSAIVSATLACLMDFFHITEADIPLALRPQLVLSVESDELDIAAGLQDRVIQAYQGCVYMDFAHSLMEVQGHGTYEYVPPHAYASLRFLLAFLADPSDSGRMHSNVKQRWHAGDETIIAGMKAFGELAERTHTLMCTQWESADYADRLADLMDENFALRRTLYGDPAIGEANLEMIECAQSFGAGAKFPGSGGAVLLLGRARTDERALQHALERMGCVVVPILPNSVE